MKIIIIKMKISNRNLYSVLIFSLILAINSKANLKDKIRNIIYLIRS